MNDYDYSPLDDADFALVGEEDLNDLGLDAFEPHPWG